MNLTDLQTVAGVAVVVSILTQLVKPYLEEKAVPLVAIALGLVVGALATLALGLSGPADLGNALLTGLLGGASAIGLYQVQKPTGILKGQDEV